MQAAERCRMKIKVIGEKSLDFRSGQHRDGPARRRAGRIFAGEGRYQEERPGDPDLVEFAKKGVIGNGVMHRYLPKDTGTRLIGRTGSGKWNDGHHAWSSGAVIED